MLTPNKHGLVACKIIVSSPANGIRAGEVRGFSPEQAQTLIDKKMVELAAPKAAKAAKADTAKADA